MSSAAVICDVVDEVAVPHRLEQRVGEPQRHQVLDRLLAQVVIDPEHLRLVEHLEHLRVELARRRQVVAERLLDHDPRLGVLALGSGRPARACRRSPGRTAARSTGRRRGSEARRRARRTRAGPGRARRRRRRRRTRPGRSACRRAARRARSGSGRRREKRSIDSRAMSRKSSSSWSRRATPIISNRSGSAPSCARLYSAGSSLRWARSPVAPKMTSAVGRTGQPLEPFDQRVFLLEFRGYGGGLHSLRPPGGFGSPRLGERRQARIQLGDRAHVKPPWS